MKCSSVIISESLRALSRHSSTVLVPGFLYHSMRIRIISLEIQKYEHVIEVYLPLHSLVVLTTVAKKQTEPPKTYFTAHHWILLYQLSLFLTIMNKEYLFTSDSDIRTPWSMSCMMECKVCAHVVFRRRGAAS